MASFVFSHFVHGVVDSIEVELLSLHSNSKFAFASAGFSHHALFEVGFGVPNDVTEEFGKLGSVFCFFPSVALESLCHFGIAFAVCLTRHGEIHSDFGAFSVEVSVEVFDHFFVAAFCYANFVFSHERESAFFGEFFELGSGNAAHGAFFGSVLAFIDETANGADEFLFHDVDGVKD